MNNVFITRPVEREGNEQQGPQRYLGDLPVIFAYVLGSTVGGGVVAFVVNRIGETLRGLDPSRSDALIVIGAAIGMLAVARVQLRGSAQMLPQRRRQVPHRWMSWRRRPLTAAAYGLMIGGGAFTFLGQASAYTVGLAALIAPSPPLAVLIGATYGCVRGSTVLGAWAFQRDSSTRAIGLGRFGNAVLALIGAALSLCVALTIV